MYLGVSADMIRMHFFPTLRNGVVAKFFRKRMTPQQALNTEPHTTQYAEPLNSLICVHRTGGLEAAAPREQNGEIRLIAADREECRADCYALSSRRKSAVSASKGAFATELFGWMTMSHPAGISSRCSRAISRRRRRIRLRTTAPPRAFLILKPKRLCGRLFAITKAVKWELERRLPER